MSVLSPLAFLAPARLRAAWQHHPEGCLLALAAVLLGLCLARPTVPVHEDLVHALLVIDVTQSMNVRDGRWGKDAVSRGEQARLGAADILRTVPCGSRIGLGIFNEYRTLVLLAPLEVCANFRELQATLDSIGNRMSWAGASEIAKGLNSGLQALTALPDKPALVMFTDGHEAPPISLAHRPKINARPGEFGGLLVGTGSLRPQSIPKLDPEGTPIGYWKADEVAQVDIYSQGRESSVAGEKYAEDPNDPASKPAAPAPKPAGTEHLSALHEAYLQQLAIETGLGYLRLEGPGQLLPALHGNHASTSTRIAGDARWLLAGLALLALVACHVRWGLPAAWRAQAGRLAARAPASLRRTARP
ncbi:MAG: VWA domain-containing protein [Pseudomonadota bacterium]|nr:VWA domain-containing protein [Pseudomonadota bacterium]